MLLFRKNSPFDPLSMNPGYDWLWNIVANSAFEFSGKTSAPVMPLLDWVPIPKTSDPLTVAVAAETAGNSTMTPLLSVANSATGFVICCATGSEAIWHDLETQL